MKHPNEGARLLALALHQEDLRHREVQAETGGSISHYLKGRLPKLLPAYRLKKRFKIPMWAWLKPAKRRRLRAPTSGIKPHARQDGQTTRQGARP